MGKGGSFIELLILALPLPLRKTTFIVGWVDARKPNNSYYLTANVGFHFVQPNLQKLN
jgi:hypothetical protein